MPEEESKTAKSKSKSKFDDTALRLEPSVGELFERSLGNAENHFLFQLEVKINTFNARHVPNHTLSLVHLNTCVFLV